jgi:hypothetical protein
VGYWISHSLIAYYFSKDEKEKRKNPIMMEERDVIAFALLVTWIMRTLLSNPSKR